MQKLNDSLKFNEGEEPENDRPHIHFATDGKGRWWKTEYKRQCPEGVFLRGGRCQGVEGHKGVHWSFNARGHFCYDDNDADSSEGGCSGSIPPDHKSYHTPLEMADHYYMSHNTHGEITDPVEIARLEAEDVGDGESVSRPCDFSKMSPEYAAELKRRSDEYKENKPKRQEPWWAFWRAEKPKID